MNPRIAVALLLGLSVALGLGLAWRWMCRRDNHPALIGVHLLAGVAGMEAVVMLLRSAFAQAASGAGSTARLAVWLVALAVMTGFAASVVLRRWSRTHAGGVVAVHALLGACGFVMFLAWALAF